MKSITIFGVQTWGYLKSTDKKELLMYLTAFGELFYRLLSEQVKNSQGNVMLAELPRLSHTLLYDKKIPIDLGKNVEEVSDTIKGSLRQDQDFIYYDWKEVDFDPDKSLNSEEESEMINVILKIMEENNVTLLVTNFPLARKVYDILEKNHEARLLVSLNKHSPEVWNSWRIFCREMQMWDEYPFTFAGLKDIPFSFPHEKRPENEEFFIALNQH